MTTKSLTSSSLVTLLEFPFKSHSAKKISSLYEIEYLNEEDKVQPTDLPDVNPYSAYRKSAFSPIKSIRTLIKGSSKQVREYVQSSRFDSFPIYASSPEQLVALEIPAEFPTEWKRAGYTHIHFGAIRLALNYHGTAGKSVVARIALLDSRYLEYQNACIATVEATALKVQVQIAGAPQIASAITTTLHYQIVYRIQDHSFNLSNHGTEDSLLISVNTNDQPHCVHVPRKIPKKELIKLFPEKWITNYEQLHEHSDPIQSTVSQIISKGDGTTEIKFDHSHLKPQRSDSNIFSTQLMMQPLESPAQLHDKEDLDCCCPLCEPDLERSLIESFSVNGKPHYMFKDPITGHCPWALNCSCELCTDDRLTAYVDAMDKTASKPGKKKNKNRNSSQDEFYRRWMTGDPDIGPLGEDNGKYVYLVDYSTRKPLPDIQVPSEPCKPFSPPPPKTNFPSLEKPPKKSKPFSLPCYKKINKWVKTNPDFLVSQNPIPVACMIKPTASTTSYDKEFPPLEEYSSENYVHVPKISSKIQTSTPGTSPKISAAEATLNWQTENAIAQNHILKRIDSKISTVESKIDDNTKMVRDLIQLLQKRLDEVARQPAAPGQDFFSHIAQREKEIQKLKDQIKTLQETGKIPEPAPRRETIELFPSIRKQNLLPAEGVQITFPELPKRTKPSTNQEEERIQKKLGKRPVSEEKTPPTSPPKQASKSLIIQENEGQNPLTKFLKDYVKSSIPKISAIQDQKSSDESDKDSSSEETRSESEELSSPGEQSENESLEKILQTTKVEEPSDDEMQQEEGSSSAQRHPQKSSIGRTTFTLDDLPPSKWPDRIQEFHSWIETRKLTEDSNYNILMEFVSRFTGMLRDWWNSIDQHNQMQFLVLQDLAQPIRIIHQHFVGNPDDLLTLKRREFYKRKCCSYTRKDLEKHFKVMTKLFCALGLNPNLKPVILSSLPNTIQVAVNQALQTQNKEILQITVGELQQEVFVALEDICNRRMIFRDYLHSDKKIDKACNDSHLKYKCPKDDHLCDFRTRKKKHFKKHSFYSRKRKKIKPRWRYLRKKRKTTKSDHCYICNQKGHFSKNCPKNKKGKKIAQIMKKSGIKIQDDDDIESVCSIEDQPSEKTICAIPVYDSTGYSFNSESDYSDFQMIQAKAQKRTIDRTIDDAASAPHIPVKIYLDKYSKPITIITFIDTGAAETFMNPDVLPIDCITTTVLGSKLPGKDIVVGFDLYKKAQYLRILPEESHSEFLNKCPNLLWKNPDFFIQLPFKKNEDINPIKASHQEMNPDHLLLAQKECQELQQQDLIEFSDSQWACEAFYVNKRSEQQRGKLRLVINYQPLNQFLQDNKFPLPNKDLLFSSIAKAKIFSKFDLKAGFWQLGIHPDDRPKTGFCIPNGHFQWKVMPFGLKTAPSLFQKAMIKIFHPLMENALVYIDDILLYSKDEDSHAQLLENFRSLISKYGIMLSERTMQINKSEIQFLGMDIKEGKYSPGPHIAQELLKFPSKNFSFKQIQQFIGIVNYVRDFIPKVSKYTNPLRKLLKKDPPPWSSSQTKALQRLKELSQDLPHLKIPSDGKRILQTDANDKYWGAILFEETDGKRYLCGYKSGRFSDAEIHYRSTFKEILAVKKGIAKFEFHLRGYQFLIEMDMSSFPQMLKFKQKVVPHPQLLRWAEWFSEFSFEVKHIPGKQNVLADLLSRPKENPKVIAYKRVYWPRSIMMYKPYSSTSSSPTPYTVTPNLHPEFPPEVFTLVEKNCFHQKAKDMMLEYQIQIFKNFGGLVLKPWGIHPDYPFIHPIRFEFVEQPNELKWFLWYLTHLYHIAIQFNTIDLLYYLKKAIRGNIEPEQQNFFTFLSWFHPLPQWLQIIEQHCNQPKGTYGSYIIIIFYKPQYFVKCGKATQLNSFPTSWLNRTVPIEIWPPPDIDAPWDTWPQSYTPYHLEVLDALCEYRKSIPDPTEWSQDYPWQYSQINLEKIELNDEKDEEMMCYSEDSLDSAQLPHSNANS
ncbi:hypothetical protein CXB51_009828 [Gossypium anomalum]|uniref:Reverse transcriptase n=1 Tax=Gossypium anomalum TaxID=47600 RepID=A0A8J5Z5Y7_9ROSI|nr:hypothetical protein CXB51_009828 [Gossypium anomalum]